MTAAAVAPRRAPAPLAATSVPDATRAGRNAPCASSTEADMAVPASTTIHQRGAPKASTPSMPSGVNRATFATSSIIE